MYWRMGASWGLRSVGKFIRARMGKMGKMGRREKMGWILGGFCGSWGCVGLGILRIRMLSPS